MSSVSPPRTSPTMIRSGRMRSELRTRSRIEISPRPSTLDGRASSVTTCGCCRRSSALSSTVMMRSVARHGGRQRVEQRRLARAGAAGDDDVQPRLDQRAQQRDRRRASIELHADELVEREQAREAADRQRRALERQRRDDHVHALAGGQAGVDHRAGLVDAAVDLRDDAVDRLVELRLVGEGDVRALQAAVALDVDLVGPVDHDLGHGRVGEQRLEHAEADRLVDHLPDQPRALAGREHRALAADHPPDDALQARAALRRGQLGELGEVDLLEQPAAVEGDAVARRWRRRGARRRCGP